MQLAHCCQARAVQAAQAAALLRVQLRRKDWLGRGAAQLATPQAGWQLSREVLECRRRSPSKQGGWGRGLQQAISSVWRVWPLPAVCLQGEGCLVL